MEGRKLPNPLAEHLTLVRGICMKDRKCHPISKMCRHCGSKQPPPYSGCLVLHHQCPRDQAAIRHTSCKRGCCCPSSYSSCSFPGRIPHKDLKTISLTSPPYCRSSASFIRPRGITSPTKHTPPTLHQAANTRAPRAHVSLISQPEQEVPDLRGPCSRLRQWSSQGAGYR